MQPRREEDVLSERPARKGPGAGLREVRGLDQGGDAPEDEIDEQDQAYQHLAGLSVDYLSLTLGSHGWD